MRDIAVNGGTGWIHAFDALRQLELRPQRHGLKGCFLALAVVDRVGRPNRERLRSAA
jgi:hypothetical protein